MKMFLQIAKNKNEVSSAKINVFVSFDILKLKCQMVKEKSIKKTLTQKGNGQGVDNLDFN